jgi:hypothetical protein
MGLIELEIGRDRSHRINLAPARLREALKTTRSSEIFLDEFLEQFDRAQV